MGDPDPWPLDYSYGDPRYWKERYKEHLDLGYASHDGSFFDWYNFGWNELESCVGPFLKSALNLLEIGVGNSPISFEIHKFIPNCDILNMDISDRVISHMLERDKHGEMKWVVGDAVDLVNVVNGQKFDVIFDKGTIDAVYHGIGIEGEGEHGAERCESILRGIESCLKPCGRFICVSQCPAMRRKAFFSSVLPHFRWLEARNLPKPDSTVNIDVSLLVLEKPGANRTAGLAIPRAIAFCKSWAVVGTGKYLNAYDLSTGVHFDQKMAFDGSRGTVLGASVLGSIVLVWGIRCMSMWRVDGGYLKKLRDFDVAPDFICNGKLLSSEKVVVGHAHNTVELINLEGSTEVSTCSEQPLILSMDVTNLMEIASGTIFGEILVWNFGDPAIKYRLNGHNGSVFRVFWHGTSLVSASDDRTVRLWNDGACIHVLYGHNARVWDCALTSNQIFSACEDGMVRIFDRFSGKLMLSHQAHQGSVWTVAVAQSMIMTGGADCQARVWAYQQDDIVLQPPGTRACVVALADSIIVGTEDGCVYSSDWQVIDDTFEYPVKLLAVSREYIAACDAQGHLHLIKDGDIEVIDTEMGPLVSRVIFDSHAVWVTSRLGQAKAFMTGDVVGRLDASADITALASSANVVLVGTFNGRIASFRPSAECQTSVNRVHAHGEGIVSVVKYDPDNDVFMTCGKNKVKMWRIDSDLYITCINIIPVSLVSSIAAYDSKLQLVAGMHHHDIIVWDLVNECVLLRALGIRTLIRTSHAVKLSEDEITIVFLRHGCVHVVTNKPSITPTSALVPLSLCGSSFHHESVISMVIWHDMIATGGEDASIRLTRRDGSDLVAVSTIFGPSQSSISALAVANDVLFSGGGKEGIQMWEWDFGIALLICHWVPVGNIKIMALGASFSDGKYLVTAAFANEKVTLFEVKGKESRVVADLQTDRTILSLVQHGSIAYGGSTRGVVTSWNLSNGDVIGRWKCRKSAITAISLRPVDTGIILASGGDDGCVSLRFVDSNNNVIWELSNAHVAFGGIKGVYVISDSVITLSSDRKLSCWSWSATHELNWVWSHVVDVADPLAMIGDSKAVIVAGNGLEVLIIE